MTVELGRTDYYDTTYPQFPVTPNGVQKGLPLTITTIPKALGPMGYKCANFGKWHLTSDPGEAGYVAHDGPNNNDPGQTIDSTTLDGITDPKRMGEITTKAMAFMEEQVGQGTPFYVQLSHYAMHEGRECFPATRAKYQNIPAIVAYNGGKTDPALINRKSDPAVWLGMADDLDGKIGQVLQKITDLGIADNTYVIMVSDNGYREDFFDEISGLFQPLHAHKWWAWQGGIRVAMVVKGPGIPANSLCTANVVNYDFLPTFVEWAGGDPSRLPDIDGTSLAGLFEGEPPGEAFLNRSLYFHYPHYRTTMPHSAIVKGQYKVVYFYETPVRFPAWDPVMLFDLKNDPGEYHNIAAEQPALAQALYSDLTNQLATAGGRIPLDNSADYDPAVYAAASEYNYRVANGPFIGTRTPQSDESPQIQTFSDYWMDSWGVDIGNDTNDYDHDGIANWVEYAMGSDPTDPSSIGTVPALENDGGTLTYRYAKRNDDSSLEYTVETTTNLMSGIWAPAGGREDVNETAGVLDEVIHSVPMDDPQSFIRLKISDE
jgi:arylsulfatase A-like enzyme